MDSREIHILTYTSIRMVLNLCEPTMYIVQREKERRQNNIPCIHVLGCDVNKPASHPACSQNSNIHETWSPFAYPLAYAYMYVYVCASVSVCVRAYIHFQCTLCNIRNWYTQIEWEFKERITSMSNQPSYTFILQYIVQIYMLLFSLTSPRSRSL